MKDKPGYQLPAEGADTEDTKCVLVFYPDKDEYRRALFGSLSYLGTWLAWELDDAKRGRQAAQVWKNANDQTLECWNMGCLEQLQEDVAAIRALLAGADYCCDGNTVINPPPGQETEITPGVGDPPDYYGETEITTWEEWEQHVCYNAHRWVDDLIATAETLNEGSNTGILTLTLIAAALALLSFSGIGIPIAITIAITALSAITAGGALIFADTADALESARDDIVCALLLGGDVEQVINDALGEASLDYTSFFQHVDYSSATAIIYEGGANGEYLPDDTLATCTCEEPLPASGAFARHATILDVYNVTADGSGWTTNSIDFDGNSFDISVTHKLSSGHYYYFDVVVAANPYYGTAGLETRGMVFLDFKQTHRTARYLDVQSGGLLDPGQAAYDNQSGYVCYNSEPVTEYNELLRVSMGVGSWVQEYYNRGLIQNPDQTRTIHFRWLAEDYGLSVPYTYHITLADLWWAMWIAP